MKNLAASIITIFVLLMWLVGLVLADGFWSTLFAVIIPPWAMYLTTEAYIIPLLDKL